MYIKSERLNFKYFLMAQYKLHTCMLYSTNSVLIVQIMYYLK